MAKRKTATRRKVTQKDEQAYASNVLEPAVVRGDCHVLHNPTDGRYAMLMGAVPGSRDLFMALRTTKDDVVIRMTPQQFLYFADQISDMAYLIEEQEEHRGPEIPTQNAPSSAAVN